MGVWSTGGGGGHLDICCNWWTLVYVCTSARRYSSGWRTPGRQVRHPDDRPGLGVAFGNQRARIRCKAFLFGFEVEMGLLLQVGAPDAIVDSSLFQQLFFVFLVSGMKIQALFATNSASDIYPFEHAGRPWCFRAVFFAPNTAPGIQNATESRRRVGRRSRRRQPNTRRRRLPVQT